jgi:hypothetical protein
MARMTAAEAYRAGRADFTEAYQETRRTVSDQSNMYLTREERQALTDRVLKKALLRLWQERVDKGELPPLNETEG